MRVYNRAIGGASWASVEDYLPVGQALGYGMRWQLELDTNTVMMAGSGGMLQIAIAYQDNFGVDLSPQMTPCVEQVVAPTMEKPCPPLGSGDGCEEGASLLVAYAITPCAILPLPPTRPCTPKERKQCKRCCKLDVKTCTVTAGIISCTCRKACNEKQWDACHRDCRGKGKPGAASCEIFSGCVGGRPSPPPTRICVCIEPPIPPVPPAPPRPRPTPPYFVAAGEL